MHAWSVHHRSIAYVYAGTCLAWPDLQGWHASNALGLSLVWGSDQKAHRAWLPRSTNLVWLASLSMICRLWHAGPDLFGLSGLVFSMAWAACLAWLTYLAWSTAKARSANQTSQGLAVMVYRQGCSLKSSLLCGPMLQAMAYIYRSMPAWLYLVCRPSLKTMANDDLLMWHKLQMPVCRPDHQHCICRSSLVYRPTTCSAGLSRSARLLTTQTTGLQVCHLDRQ